MQCADCASDLDDALILVCDHNLCLSCAAKKSAGSTTIRCRVCQSVTNLEASSAQQLKEMFPQFSMKTSFNRPPIPPPILVSNTICGQCESMRADLRCLQCEEILCFDCSETLHRRGKLASHQVVPINLPPTAAATVSSSMLFGGQSPMSSRSVFGDRSVITMRSVGCHNHPDEPIQYFCLRCETKPMCAECVFRSGDHSNHLSDVVLVKKAFPKIRSRMNDLIVSFEKSIKENKFLELNLFENKKSIETIGSNSRLQVEKYFSELRALIREREIQMVGQINSAIDVEVGEIDKEVKNCAVKRDKMESVSKLLQEVSTCGTGDEGGPTSITEREIEVLESFSEMKSVISDTRSEKNNFKLVQLYIPSDCVALMDKQVSQLKSEITNLCSIVPTRNIPSSTPESSASVISANSSSRKKKVIRKGTTAGDMFLINAIDDAIRSG